MSAEKRRGREELASAYGVVGGMERNDDAAERFQWRERVKGNVCGEQGSY